MGESRVVRWLRRIDDGDLMMMMMMVVMMMMIMMMTNKNCAVSVEQLLLLLLLPAAARQTGRSSVASPHLVLQPQQHPLIMRVIRKYNIRVVRDLGT